MPPAIASAATTPNSVVLARGVIWIAAARWSSQIIAWSVTLYMARLLTTREYGWAGLVSVVSSWVYSLSEFGIASTMLALRDEGLAKQRSLHTLVVLLTLGGSALIALGAIPAAAFMRDRELAPLLAVGGLLVLAQGFSAVPMALLQLRLDFRTVARIEFSRSLVNTLGVAAFALSGFRVWSLPLAALSGALVQAALSNHAVRVPFTRVRLAPLREMLAYARHIVVGRIAWLTYLDADVVMVGRAVGTTVAGQYQFAWNIATLPGEKLVNVVTAALLPFFSAIAEDLAKLRKYLLLMTEGLALVIFPVFIGIIAVADEAIPLLFGAKWQPAILPLKLLICYALIQALSSVMTNAASALRMARDVNRVPVFALLILPPCFYLAARYSSLASVALVWLVAAPAMAAWPMRLVLRRLDVRTSTFFASLITPTVASLTMLAVVAALQRWVTRPSHPMAALAVDVAAGGATYLLTLLVVFPTRVRWMIDAVNAVRASRRATG
ncbi:MAG: oligosaccharide flippase family protein [Gemmatimonadaceae bacterium]|nr:oligosaccharide flippase family protein [Gemmatimonadaceae bacterium]